jgi:sarcosine oxidase subunit delta
MKLITCPLNGPRNVSEFLCAGPLRSFANDIEPTEAAWTDYLFLEENRKGVVLEWWCHLPTSYWFIAERNTETDEILNTYPPEDAADRMKGLS